MERKYNKIKNAKRSKNRAFTIFHRASIVEGFSKPNRITGFRREATKHCCVLSPQLTSTKMIKMFLFVASVASETTIFINEMKDVPAVGKNGMKDVPVVDTKSHMAS